jgi:uncharacterized protein YndB with AHSA1/START domain
MMNETILTHQGTKLTIERTINAPKDKVWEAYASADVFAQWFSTDGWTTRVKHFDFTAGGYVLFAMKCEDESQKDWYGQESWNKSVYSVVTPKDAFIYKDYFCDENGNPTEGMPATEIEVNLQEIDGKTTITSISTYDSEASLEQALAMGMEQGIKQTFNKLANVIE